MPVVMVDFKQSREADRQRYVRSIIRKIKRHELTRGERDVLMAMVNLWFYHKCGPLGFIHPGRAKLARKAGVSVVTVARALARLRAYGVVDAIEYAQGGRRATRYQVHLDCIIETFNPHGVESKTGDLVPFKSSNDTVCDAGNDTVTPYQNDTRYLRADQAKVSEFLSVGESLIDYADVF